MKKYFFSTILTFIIFTFIGCFSVKYSFTGASIDPKIKTVSVQYFENRAPIVQPDLSQQFTDALKDRIESQTNLKMVNGFGDVNFEGEITKFLTRPKSVTADERASQTRFSITIRVKYSNTVDPEWDFDKSFEKFEDFESTENFEDVREDLTETIVDLLVDDIFNQAFVNW